MPLMPSASVVVQQGSPGPTGPAGLPTGDWQPYTFDASTNTGSDPGVGEFRLNSATPTVVTTLAISETNFDSDNVQSWLESWASYGNAVEDGILKFQSRSDPTQWSMYRVVGLTTTEAGWSTATLTWVASNGTLPTTAGDTVVGFAPRGTDGDPGDDGADAMLAYYLLDMTTQADSDPGSGKLVFNNADPTAATKLFVDLAANGGGSDVTALLDSLDDSTNPVKGYLRLVNVSHGVASELALWIVYKLTAVETASGYRKLNVTYVDDGGFTASALTGDVVILQWAPSGDIGPAATGQLFLSAAGMWPSTTGGCADAVLTDSGSNDVNYYGLDFDATTNETAEAGVTMPSDWDAGTVTATFYWMAVTDTGTGTCIWGARGVSFGDGDAINTAYGTNVNVTDNNASTALQVRISSATGAITVAGAAAGEYVQFKITRDAATDTMTGDARLLGVMIAYTRT